MPRRRSPALTDAELRIMNVLWARGRGTVGDVVDGLDGPKKPAYNSVLTILRILEKKSYVTHAKEGRAFTYVPVVGRGEARRGALSHLLSRFFDDSPELLVLNLLGKDGAHPDEVQRVRELIDRSRGEGGR
jgi:BlaI family transcriptional regulator, penicillinase repressor